MTAARAGTVQGAFTASFVISLLVVSFLCDRFGAKRVFVWSAIACAVSAVFFAVSARSFESALVCMALLGATQGASYTPAIILASTNAQPHRKASAVGWILAGMSAGYVISILVANVMLAVADYRLSFAVTSAIAVVGSALSVVATRHAVDPASALEATGAFPYSRAHRSYVGVVRGMGMDSRVSNGVAAVSTSHDRHRNRPLDGGYAPCLRLFGLFPFGVRSGPIWRQTGSRGLFSHRNHLFARLRGSVLGHDRSRAPIAAWPGAGSAIYFWVGAGSVSPIVFGLAVDFAPASLSWGLAFSTLAAGGMLAVISAAALRR